jgi:DNA-binding transcriptional LysR family regulator
MPARDEFDWDDLRYFLAAARASSLAGAARTLQVEHSTVGRRLKSLERTLGGSLFLRKPEGLELTPVGAEVFAAAQAVERAVLEVTERAGAGQERVRVAVPSGMASYFTAHLERLRAKAPNVALEIVSGAKAVDLSRSEADLAVRLGPIEDPDLVARRVGDVGWSLFAARAYLERKPMGNGLLDLRGHDVIGFDPLLADSAMGQWLDLNARDATIVMRGREMVDIAGAAAAGAGIALLPCFMAVNVATLIRLTPTTLLTRELALVYRREMRMSPAVRVAIDFTIDVLEALRPLLDGRLTASPPGRNG